MNSRLLGLALTAALALATVGAAPVASTANLGGATATADGLRHEPLVLLVDDLVELEEPVSHAAPVPEDSVGIGPGSTLIINFHDPSDGGNYTGICTAAFIFRDASDGRAYLGSAGHCFLGGSFTSTHGDDADWDPAWTERVRVCVSTCIGGASGLVSAALGFYPGATRDLGDLVYARQNTGGSGVGHDFGIVEIPEDLWDEIRTEMPMWGGPMTTELRDVEQGDPVVHYGNGVAFGEVVPTKGRGGMGTTSDANRWIIASAASPGDSGSAANIAVAGPDGVLHGEWAAGILTHLVTGIPNTGVAGTTTRRALEMAQEDAGIALELVIDVAELGEGGNGGGTDPGGDDPAEPLSATIDAPAQVRAGEQVTFDGTASTGDIVHWRWEIGNDAVYEGEDLATVGHTFRQPGARLVVLTVTDENGETAQATHRIRVQGPPVPDPE